MDATLNPFWQGFYAFNDGLSLEECPFAQHLSDTKFWYDGFTLAHSLVHGRGRKGLR